MSKYKECLKNHAAGIGGHAVDGCGEFMPSGDIFKCAVCNCHRNFHRKDTVHHHHPCGYFPHIMPRRRSLVLPSTSRGTSVFTYPLAWLEVNLLGIDHVIYKVITLSKGETILLVPMLRLISYFSLSVI